MTRERGWHRCVWAAWLLSAALAGGTAGCHCGPDTKGITDTGTGATDATPGTDAAPATDAGPEQTQCERICDLVATCGVPGLGGDACGPFCARADGGVLACLDTAAAAGDCGGALTCILSAPAQPECDPICTFWDTCMLPMGLCDAACNIVNDATRGCATTAASSMDCTLLGACLVDPMTAATCSDVCTFAVETCGQAIPFGTLGCIAACGGGLIPDVIIGCYGVASFLNSCDAANVCGSLIGIPPPGTDAGVPGTDATPSGTDAASATDGATPGTDAACDGGPGSSC
ncbi:MAG TPA: hypothetical protein VG389_11310 [Myxococcota bacterium]|jgi:hypothetical protein|nr:hypothetical protein [Myxococcota bacterium]